MTDYNAVLNLFETSDRIDNISQSSYIIDPSSLQPIDWDSSEGEDGPWEMEKTIKNPFNTDNINLLIAAAIRIIVLHPVRLEIVYSPDINKDDPVDYDENDLSHSDERWCKNNSGLDSVIFPDINKIVAITENQGNKDSRGGGCGCCGFTAEDFIWSENTDGVKLFDLASIVYRLKGSKYDWWYELYDNTDFIIIDKTLYLKVEFSYGS